MASVLDRVRDIAAEHCPGLTPRQAAGVLLSEMRQYERHNLGEDMRCGFSSAPAGSLRAELYDLAALGGLPDKKQLTNILRENFQATAS